MTYIPLPVINSATVATTETTTSTTYTDLATVGPSVTLIVGPSGQALITISALSFRVAINNSAWISVDVSGASTVAASDTNSAECSNLNYGSGSGLALAACHSRTFLLTGLTPGSTTFRMKYRIDGGTAYSFFNRSIAVFAL